MKFDLATRSRHGHLFPFFGGRAAPCFVMNRNTQTLDLRSLIQTLAADESAVVYVTDNESLWQIVAIDRGCFVLSDCAEPYGKRKRERTVAAVELALTYRRVEPRLAPPNEPAVGSHSN